MSRNTESHFGNIPTKDIRRSKLKMPFRHLTTFNTGDIIPIFHREVLPGDTFKMNESMVVRMQTPITPVMDNAWIDTYYFFVPRRLVWEHWKEFMGENNTDAWTQETEYTIPKTTAPEGGWSKGSIASYLGARMYTDNIWIDSCYLRAYALIYNEWFRNENVSEPAEVTLTDANATGTNGTDYVVDAQLGGMPCKAVKYADYFTRALPSPQKGEDVLLPLGDWAPVYPRVEAIDESKISEALAPTQMKIFSAGGQWLSPYTGNVTVSNESGVGYLKEKTDTSQTNDYYMTFSNLWTDMSAAVGATINQLRQAFAVQRLAELDARGGKVA